MRYYNYLNENIYTIEEINELIKKDCKYYLSLIGNNAIFTRAISGSISFPFIKKQTRQDRKSRGMMKNVFNDFNDWLKMKKHVERDKAVIASSLETKETTRFGNNYYLFPIGKFNYTYAETNDINLYDYDTRWYASAVKDFVTYNETDLPKPFESYFHTNKNINVAYNNNYEIWFDCKEYYIASISNYIWDKSRHKLVSK